MPYEITPLLLKCGATDFSVLISQIDSYVNFSSDSELKELLAAYRERTPQTPQKPYWQKLWSEKFGTSAVLILLMRSANSKGMMILLA